MVSVSSTDRPATYMNKAAVKPVAAATKTQMLAVKNLPLDFIPNRGQVDGQVSFYIKGSDRTVYFTPAGVTLALRKTEIEGKVSKANSPAERKGRRAPSGRSWVIKMDFIGARKDAAPEGLERSGAVFSYFKGGREDWQAGLPGYRRIIYRELWPGVDLVYMGDVGRLKYEFVLRPGADPRLIKIGVSGASGVKIDGEGQLVLETPLENIVDEKPFVYQEDKAGERKSIQAAYEIKKMLEGGAQLGFSLGDYDPDFPLVIDPAIFIYCGYINGVCDVESDQFDVAVDCYGNAYVVGSIPYDESNFPVTVGPDTSFNGDKDAFVAKINAAGTGFDYCGYIGGSEMDLGGDITVDGLGNAYVTGRTWSDETTFPVINGPDLTYNGGYCDAFVAKVNAAGTGLDYCGFIGGADEDYGHGVRVDGSGNAYVTGETWSDETTFPVSVGPRLFLGGKGDAFVAKVNTAGTGLDYCGYIGGSDMDLGHDIAVDGAGNAYVTGHTGSNEATFPVINGPDLTYNGDFNDAFVAKVNAAGTGLEYCGYIGGSDMDMGYSIAVDGSGNAYVTGYTESNEATFPVINGPDLTYNGGFRDAFVAKVNAAGTGFDYCGYIGGDDTDQGEGIAVDGSGNAYVTGIAYSDAATFPVTVGPDLTRDGDYDVFVAKMNPFGTGFAYCGYIGGNSWEDAEGIAVDLLGNAYVIGLTSSAQSTFPVTVGPGLVKTDYCAAFVAKIGDIPSTSGIADIGLSKGVDKVSCYVGDKVVFWVSVRNFGPSTASRIKVSDKLPLGLRFLSARVTQGYYNPRNGRWTVGKLKIGSWACLTLKARVRRKGAFVNRAALLSLDQSDNNSANNTAKASLQADPKKIFAPLESSEQE